MSPCPQLNNGKIIREKMSLTLEVKLIWVELNPSTVCFAPRVIKCQPWQHSNVVMYGLSINDVRNLGGSYSRHTPETGYPCLHFFGCCCHWLIASQLSTVCQPEKTASIHHNFPFNSVWTSIVNKIAYTSRWRMIATKRFRLGKLKGKVQFMEKLLKEN